MKKIFLCAILLVAICLTGCGSNKDKDIRDSFIKDVSGLKSYYMEGILKITNNDDTYEYDVKTSFKKDDLYKVSMINKANDYEQIIVKNNDGVYVITPSLNKSFKFQSDWPNNNSQSYLIDSVANDLKNDNDYTFTKKGSDYIFTIKTNYPNNPKYTKQNVILDKNKKLKKVEVQDDDDVTYVEYEVKKFDNKKDLSDKEFSLDEITKDFSNNIKDEPEKQKSEEKNNENEIIEESNNTNKTSKNETEESSDINENNERQDESSKTDNNVENSETSQNNRANNTNETSKEFDSVFPLYLPSNTSLSDKEVIDTKAGQRVIMTFSGDNPFILVEETAAPSSNLEVIPTYGEPFMLIDTVGSLTDTSYTWTSNGKEYYIVSDQMEKSELLEVAKSINVMSVITKK